MESLSVSRASRTHKRASSFVAAFVCGAALGVPNVAHAAPLPDPAKVPLAYPLYDRYNAIADTTISDGGRYVAYVLMPGEGDPTLVVHDCTTGVDVREPRGIKPTFTADEKYVVFTIRAPNDALRKARREHKKKTDLPTSGLGILELATGTVATVERVKSVVLPHDAGNDFIAYLRGTPSPGDVALKGSPSPSPLAAQTSAPQASPPASPSPNASASASATPNASPSASATPNDLHKKDDANELVIRDLPLARETTIAHVSDYAVSHDGTFVAYATQSADGKTDAVFIHDDRSSAGSSPQRLSLGAGHYRKLTFAPKTDVLAFMSDAATFAEPAPRFAQFVVDARSPTQTLAPVLAAEASGLPLHWAPSTAASPAFSKDARYLYVGTAPAPTPVPSGTPEPLPVDIWNYRDVDLQSQQRVEAETERKRSYRAAIDLTTHSFAQLGTPEMRDIDETLEPGAAYALGLDDSAYRRASSWRDDRHDVYAVSLATGARTRIVTGLRDEAHFSPTGRFVATYDALRRTWFATKTSDGTRIDLTSKLGVSFFDELDDHPDLPPPYDFVGWLDGDRAALVSDRYDIWAIDPQSGRARMLTFGIGRREKLRFSLDELDSEATSFSSTKPILAEAMDDRTKDRLLFALDATQGMAGRGLRQILRVADAFTKPLRARNADRIVLGERSFARPLELYSAPSLAESFGQLSNAHPEVATYRGGTERLISYRSRTGVPLRGILFEPASDGTAPRAKRPMLVYFYERFSDDLHQMPFTVPGPGTSPNLLRYVSHGYVVFVPDVAYRVGHPGESAYDCIMPGVDAAIAAGNVDSARIGIAGHSWAAYQIAYLLTRTNRFRAAEAGAAVGDMVSAYGGLRIGTGVVREFQYEVGQSRIGTAPWERPDLYLENSALFHIRSVRTPYLTIANNEDGAVPWQQGIEFFTALRRLDKEAYLFEFDGEDHNLKDRDNQKYWTVHLDEFFDHYLLGTPQPAWMDRGVDFLHRGQRDVRTLFGEQPANGAGS